MRLKTQELNSIFSELKYQEFKNIENKTIMNNCIIGSDGGYIFINIFAKPWAKLKG